VSGNLTFAQSQAIHGALDPSFTGYAEIIPEFGIWLVGTSAANSTALDARTGTIMWKSIGEYSGYSFGHFFVTVTPDTLDSFVIDVNSKGKVVNEFPLGNYVGSDGCGTMLFLNDQNVFAFSALEQTPYWTFSLYNYDYKTSPKAIAFPSTSLSTALFIADDLSSPIMPLTFVSFH